MSSPTENSVETELLERIKDPSDLKKDHVNLEYDILNQKRKEREDKSANVFLAVLVAVAAAVILAFCLMWYKDYTDKKESAEQAGEDAAAKAQEYNEAIERAEQKQKDLTSKAYNYKTSGDIVDAESQRRHGIDNSSEMRIDVADAVKLGATKADIIDNLSKQTSITTSDSRQIFLNQDATAADKQLIGNAVDDYRNALSSLDLKRSAFENSIHNHGSALSDLRNSGGPFNQLAVSCADDLSNKMYGGSLCYKYNDFSPQRYNLDHYLKSEYETTRLSDVRNYGNPISSSIQYENDIIQAQNDLITAKEKLSQSRDSLEGAILKERAPISGGKTLFPSASDSQTEQQWLRDKSVNLDQVYIKDGDNYVNVKTYYKNDIDALIANKAGNVQYYVVGDDNKYKAIVQNSVFDNAIDNEYVNPAAGYVNNYKDNVSSLNLADKNLSQSVKSASDHMVDISDKVSADFLAKESQNFSKGTSGDTSKIYSSNGKDVYVGVATPRVDFSIKNAATGKNGIVSNGVIDLYRSGLNKSSNYAQSVISQVNLNKPLNTSESVYSSNVPVRI